MFVEYGRGEQSLVGFLKCPSQDSVFAKVPRDIGFSSYHEWSIAARLAQFPQLQNFYAQARGLVAVWSAPVLRVENDEQISFVPIAGWIQKSALSLQFYKSEESLREFIERVAPQDPALCSAILVQVLCAIRLAQEACDFTHYDMHGDNILVCPRPVTQAQPSKMFKFKDGSGCECEPIEYEMVIIDFGRAYCDSLVNTPVNVELFNTHAGLFSIRATSRADMLFLLSSCGEVFPALDEKLTAYQAHVDAAGWWESRRASALAQARALVNIASQKSRLFSADLNQCLVIFSHLCILPLETSEQHDPAHFWPYYFEKFLLHWCGVERFFENVARLQYFLCYLVSTCNAERENYYTTLDPAPIRMRLEAFLNAECEDRWLEAGLEWAEMIRCVYLAGQMLEGILASVIAEQHAQFCQECPDVGFARLVEIVRGLNANEPSEQHAASCVEFYDSERAEVSVVERAVALGRVNKLE
jgi:hypothetical protein